MRRLAWVWFFLAVLSLLFAVGASVASLYGVQIDVLSCWIAFFVIELLAVPGVILWAYLDYSDFSRDSNAE